MADTQMIVQAHFLLLVYGCRESCAPPVPLRALPAPSAHLSNLASHFFTLLPDTRTYNSWLTQDRYPPYCGCLTVRRGHGINLHASSMDLSFLHDVEVIMYHYLFIIIFFFFFTFLPTRIATVAFLEGPGGCE